MKKLLASMAAVISMTAHAEDAQGIWTGSIANSLHVTVKFEKTPEGKWEATMSVPAQNLVTKVDDVSVAPDRIGFALNKLRASYAATWNERQQAWTGTWTQGRTAPLNLKRTTEEAARPKRPQEDAIAARPASYASTEVAFDNAAAGVKLAGTFTVPQGKGPFPAVVLVHGSGSIDRDGSVFGHKTLLVLADHLSRQGIAVLRYDKRGVGKSSGKLKEATTRDLAADAEAALRFLRGRAEVDSQRIGVIGHSEGGLVAPLLASRDPGIAFVVMLAGPGVRGDRLLVEQHALLARARGVPEAAIEKDRTMNRALFAAMVEEPTLEAARNKAGLILAEAERKGDLPAGLGASALERFGTPWFRELLAYEPAPVLRAVRQPILVLNGERDLQVPAGLDLPPIRAALAGNPRAVVKEMPRLNHLFQTAKTGGIEEYGQIEESFAPAALDTIAGWIKSTVE
ncbi:alpha/beta fold hydrolase [Massilia sp. YIM B02769]|uniref:alpha/beta hydrolase family protein n=1 Tax=Massilia sp. YIM B02769 TaxID=3050129 RepID=UPI0025B643EB|nr:alpha/beta fold hydrolase [Massilia sp. YIM B02769]MDN4059807.1 alpha/beta fold hydrolase [Massilia sp. YIM B02769]